MQAEYCLQISPTRWKDLRYHGVLVLIILLHSHLLEMKRRLHHFSKIVEMAKESIHICLNQMKFSMDCKSSKHVSNSSNKYFDCLVVLILGDCYFLLKLKRVTKMEVEQTNVSLFSLALNKRGVSSAVGEIHTKMLPSIGIVLEKLTSTNNQYIRS